MANNTSPDDSFPTFQSSQGKLYRLATPGYRLLVTVMGMALFFLSFFLLSGVVFLSFLLLRSLFHLNFSPPVIWILGIITLVLLVLQAFFWSFFQVGKRIFGLKVIDRQGRTPSRFRLVLRDLCRFLLGLLTLPLLAFLAWFWIFFSKENQNLHDKLLGLYVVHREKRKEKKGSQ